MLIIVPALEEQHALRVRTCLYACTTSHSNLYSACMAPFVYLSIHLSARLPFRTMSSKEVNYAHCSYRCTRMHVCTPANICICMHVFTSLATSRSNVSYSYDDTTHSGIFRSFSNVPADASQVLSAAIQKQTRHVPRQKRNPAARSQVTRPLF